MADTFRMTYCDAIPDTPRRKSKSKYATAIQQFIRAGKKVAQIHAQSEKTAGNIVAGFRKEIKLGNHPVECTKRGQDIYLTRKEKQP